MTRNETTKAALCSGQAKAYDALPDLFDEPFTCARCGDTGLELLADNTCRPCACSPMRKTRSRLARAGLLGAGKRMTFDAFRTDAPWQETLLSRARAFAGQENPGWLFIGGQSGSGKTHLCTAAAVALLRRGYAMQYMRWMSESTRLKEMSMDSGRMKLMDAYISAPLLYVDDLFKATPTDADKHIAFELLDARYNDHSKVTILSSERTLDAILVIDEAIGGRILERCGAYVLRIAPDVQRNYRRMQSFGMQRPAP